MRKKKITTKSGAAHGHSYWARALFNTLKMTFLFLSNRTTFRRANHAAGMWFFTELLQMRDVSLQIAKPCCGGGFGFVQLSHHRVGGFHRVLSSISSGVAMVGTNCPSFAKVCSILRRAMGPAMCLKFQLAIKSTWCSAAVAMCTASVKALTGMARLATNCSASSSAPPGRPSSGSDCRPAGSTDAICAANYCKTRSCLPAFGMG